MPLDSGGKARTLEGMKHSLMLIAFAGLLLAGCQHVQSDPRLILQDDYTREHLEVNLQEFTDGRGQIGLQATVRNISDDRVDFQYRFQWFTVDGQYVDSPTATWVPVHLDAHDSYVAQGAQVSADGVLPKLSLKRLP